MLPNRKLKLIDAYNRQLNYLRISITDRCNLRCVYCVPHDLIPRLPHDEILRYEEILRIARVGVDLGISKVRVTGGEPLVRKGVYEFLAHLTQINGLADVALTTNGIFLKENIEKIKSAGIRRINISLDTLDRKKYAQTTGVDKFQQVWEGIELARNSGFYPIKINVVALRGINADELTNFAKLSISYPFHIRFIEYMPIGKSRMTFEPPLLIPEIKERISSIGKLAHVKKGRYDGPAERFKFEGAQGEIGFIGALSHHFCDACNRLRLTASGQLRPCLLSDHQLDLKLPLRNGCSDKELADILLAAVRTKPSNHNLAIKDPVGVHCQMSSIGG
ncbi:MAG: GTP 3',8-cyclase MoaA [Deltaproteobacteria bacterium]|nr:MAG: GTP 3',8-cyclase MoaA [Deltaproteobacteria bacterium]